ncbi:hypothetical protein ACFL2Q_00600 [Thermodesulfobacteriota bacterium]
MRLGGDYDWEIECASCGYRVLDTEGVTLDSLLELAITHGTAANELGFTCPVCGSHYLEQVYTMSRSVRAVYETSNNEKMEPHAEVALSYEQVTEYGKSFQYCCSNDHELTKQDGAPIRTLEDLVEWLKAHQSPGKESSGQSFGPGLVQGRSGSYWPLPKKRRSQLDRHKGGQDDD